MGQRHDEQGVQGGLVEPAQSLDQCEPGCLGWGFRPVGDCMHQERQSRGAVQQVLGDNGLESIANTPAEFAAMIREDAKAWDAAAVTAGLVRQ